MGAML